MGFNKCILLLTLSSQRCQGQLSSQVFVLKIMVLEIHCCQRFYLYCTSNISLEQLPNVLLCYAVACQERLMMVVDIIWFELDRISPCNPFPNLLSFSDVQGLSQPHQLCSFVDTLTSISMLKNISVRQLTIICSVFNFLSWSSLLINTKAVPVKTLQ